MGQFLLGFPLMGTAVSGNYTVEQSWDQMVVKFHNTEFYEKFWEAIMMRYKTLSWRHQQNQLEGVVQVGKQHYSSVSRRLLITA